ncbi:MAG: hypothetical protein KH301_08315 [Brachyspira sp.]|nr:hypothetical protein [Brachyspira sp.]
MKKNAKIIEIKGLRGIAMVLFVASCLGAGFVIFPAKVAVYLWNHLAFGYLGMPLISLWQGLLLWAAVALSVFIINSKAKLLSFRTTAQLSDAEMKLLMDRIKIQAEARRLNSLLMKEQQEQNKEDEKIENKDISEKHS